MSFAISKNKWFVGAIGATLLSAAALWEGTRYEPYKDIVGVPTVCMGYTGKDIVWGKKYSHAECTELLKTELKEHAEGMVNCVAVELSPQEFNAYTLFTYNVGVGAFCKSTLAKKLNSGDHVGACNALMNWTYAGGKEVRGLVNRRAYEREMCLDGLR